MGRADLCARARVAVSHRAIDYPPPDPGVQESAILSGVYLTDLVDAPIKPDGTFEFGRVPEGTYLMDVFPSVPGMNSILFDVSNQDVNNLELAIAILGVSFGR